MYLIAADSVIDWSQMIPVALGGFIAIVGSIVATTFTAYLRNRAAYRQLKRDKLEAICDKVCGFTDLCRKALQKHQDKKVEGSEEPPPLSELPYKYNILTTQVCICMYHPELNAQFEKYKKAVEELAEKPDKKNEDTLEGNYNDVKDCAKEIIDQAADLAKKYMSRKLI